jgi:hypothetical protein
VNIKLVEALRVGGEKNFPTRKLITLWNNREWRDRTTRWCGSRLGLETLNISTFEWFASLRVDEYWFAAMEAALATLEALPVDPARDLGKDDWSRLVAALDGHRTAAGVRAAFYQGNEAARQRRTPGFLLSLDDAAYDAVCRTLSARPELALPDIKRKLRPRKAELPYMVRALQHVVGWIDVQSAVAIGAVNPRSNNKPLVRESLSAALRTLAASRGQGEPADEVAVRLQEAVLDFVDAHMDEFKAADRAIPEECQDVSRIDNGGAYADRFANGVWGRLLRLVRGFTDRDDEVLRPDWGATASPAGRSPAPGGAGGPVGRRARLLTLTETFCADILQLVDDSVSATGGVRSAIQKGIEDVLALHLASQGAFQEEAGETDADDEPAAVDAVTSGTKGTTEQTRPSTASPPAPGSMPASRKRTPPPSATAAGGPEQKRRRRAEEEEEEENTPVITARTRGRAARPSFPESSDGSDDEERTHRSHTADVSVEAASSRGKLGVTPGPTKGPAWKLGTKIGGGRGGGRAPLRSPAVPARGR